MNALGEVLAAVREGTDVYLFLAGIIALAELAHTQGVFAALADAALARLPRVGRAGAFWLSYAAGAVVTTFLSNDATILLVTPSAIAFARRAGASALPSAYAVAFVANAASFVLPISNPANLLLYPRLPSVLVWLPTFGTAALAALAVTGLLLFAVVGRSEDRNEARDVQCAAQNEGRHVILAGVLVAGSCIVLVIAACLRWNVGVTAAVCGAASVGAITVLDRTAATQVLRNGQWSIIALVAALFAALHFADRFGALRIARGAVATTSAMHWPLGPITTGFAVAAASNVVNNLPAAVLAHYAAPGNAPALVGIDLGPNIAVTGSLATILWLGVLRRAGVRTSAARFFFTGLAVNVPALAVALAAVR